MKLSEPSRLPVHLAALCLLVAWLIVDHFPPWTGFHAEVPAAVAAAILVVHTLRVATRGAASALVVVLLGLACVPWLQFAFGLVPYRGHAVLASLYLAGAALCVWAGGAAPPALRQACLRALVGGFVVAAVLSTGIALVQWFGLSVAGWTFRTAPGARAEGNLGQSNHLATLILFGLAGVALMRTWKLLGNAGATFCAGFLLLGLALSQSRTPLLAAVVIACWFAARGQVTRATLRRFAPVVLGLLLWYVAAAWMAVSLPDDLLLTTGEPQARTSAGGRPLLWAQGIAAIREAPWFGYGWLQGEAAQAIGALAVPGHEYTGGYGHNLGIDLAIWNGLPLGGLLFVGLLFWYFRRGLRVEGSTQWFQFVVISCFAVHSMVEFPYAYTYLLFPVALLAGQLEAEAGERRLPVPRTLLAGVAVAALVAGAAVARDYLRIEADLRELRAQLLRIGGVRTSEPPSDIWLLDHMAAMSRAGRIEAVADMPAQQLSDLVTVSERTPTRFLLQQAAVALALNGQGAEADRTMRKLLALYGPERFGRTLAAIEYEAGERAPQLRPHLAGWKRLLQADGPR